MDAKYLFLFSLVMLIIGIQIYAFKEKIFPNLTTGNNSKETKRTNYIENFSNEYKESDIFKLYYFKFNGRAALARAIFSYANVKFENVLIEMDKWPKMKPEPLFEFGQVPILEHNKKVLSQSKAIFLYLARLFGLYGKTLDDKYQIDSLLNSYDDITRSYYPFIFPQTEDEKKNPQVYKEKFENELKRFLKVYEKRYLNYGAKKYYLGEYFSLADIYLTVEMNIFASKLGGMDFILQNAKILGKLISRVKNSEMKKYFDTYFIQ